MNYIDLSKPEFQGSYGHNRIDQLKEPGLYKLPFRTFYTKTKEIGIRNIVVRVCGFWGSRSISQGIVVIDSMEDFTYTFYYNGAEKCFKINVECGLSLDELDQENEDDSVFGLGPERK